VEKFSAGKAMTLSRTLDMPSNTLFRLAYAFTGGGQTRFGPNLYQDGKVCLSLLGTFHATDDSERWNPKQSSLAQILLSIQTQLLVKEPVYNEPRKSYAKARYNANAIEQN
jgi:ubiquitin-protein ligase